ncbi:hypothetical protein ACFQ3W_11300 [Paenibacillus puldeungensis]|uniref:Uncharacterized protein n=1 Tax=Paenibacillus puldeungensis TaxID=696536 RepID=A0ABW3RX55_9BACL
MVEWAFLHPWLTSFLIFFAICAINNSVNNFARARMVKNIAEKEKDENM